MCQRQASSTFPGPVSGTSVLISSFEGHLVARCDFPFLHLQTVFPRSVPPLCSVLMEENRNNLFAIFTLPLPNLVCAIFTCIFLSLKTSLIFSSQPLGTSPLPAPPCGAFSHPGASSAPTSWQTQEGGTPRGYHGGGTSGHWTQNLVGVRPRAGPWAQRPCPRCLIPPSFPSLSGWTEIK